MKTRTNEVKPRILTIKFLTLVLAFAAVQSISAQYGNLISKQATDALAASNLALCWQEMSDLIKKEPNNNAARVEHARCTYLYATSNTVIEGYTKQLMEQGKSEAAAREEVKTELAKMLLGGIRQIQTVTAPYAPASNLLGLYYRYQGKTAEAQAEFNRAIALDPGNYRPYANRGKTKDMLDDTAGAIADYEKVVAFGISDPFITKRLPELKQKMGAAQTAAVPPMSAADQKRLDQCLKESEEEDKEYAKLGLKPLSMADKIKICQESAAMVDGWTKNPGSLDQLVAAIGDPKPIDDGFYAVARLLATNQGFRKQSDAFQKDYPQSADTQRRELIRTMTVSAQKALDEVNKAESGSQNFKPEDKKSIAQYKDYYTQYLAALGKMGAPSKVNNTGITNTGSPAPSDAELEANRAKYQDKESQDKLRASSQALSNYDENIEKLAQESKPISARLKTIQTDLNNEPDKNKRIAIIEGLRTMVSTALANVEKTQKLKSDYSDTNKQRMTGLYNGYTALLKKIDGDLARLRQ